MMDIKDINFNHYKMYYKIYLSLNLNFLQGSAPVRPPFVVNPFFHNIYKK